MGDGPQLEILDPIIPPVPVAMMNNLVWQKGPTQM
jgi:hypothetical protein